MTSPGSDSERPQQVVVVGPDGRPVGSLPLPQGLGDDGQDGTLAVGGMVEEPAKVMRIGTMIKQLLEEVRAAPLDEASRNRLRDIHRSSIEELEQMRRGALPPGMGGAGQPQDGPRIGGGQYL